ncbi:glycosyltransferase [Aneurinibacillus migulanus]|uniref:glycosyltransferase n=1 Tax=Aneurinibacillus migulanus TaxID=47500 RepID=UPI002E2249EE|nr:glycosyltransferase [Aneurinibacillus migulanus]MED4730247.1 glycosyltransferase [Aneurinibacillus migulanus]
MKIVQVYPKPSGGVERYAYDLIHGLARLGKEIEFHNFIAYPKGYTRNLDTEPSSNIYHENVEVDRGVKIEFNPLMDCVNPNLEEIFSQFLDRVKPDIVHFQHIHDLSGSLIGVAKEKGAKVVFTVHDYWTICPRLFLLDRDLNLCEGPNLGARCFGCIVDKKDRNNYQLFSAFLLRYQFMKDILKEKVDIIVAVSSTVRNKLIKEGIPEDKIIVSYPSVEVGEKIEKKKKVAVTFGFIGNLNVHKGPHVLISAFNRIDYNNKELHFYGNIDSLYNSTIKRLARGNEKIIFHGAYNKADLPNIFSNIDVLIVPSICMETGPLVVQEALKHNVPVIASNIGSIPEYVKSKYGALFEAGNIDELEDIMKSIMDKPEILEEWRSAIPKLTDVQDFLNESYLIYEKLLSGKKENRVRINKQHLELLNQNDYVFLRKFAVPKKIKKVTKMLLENEYLNICIFGAGDLGGKVSKYVQNQGINVKFFIDNDKKKWSKIYEGIPIIGPESMPLFNINAILVASDWEMEILKQLDDLNLEIPIIGLYSFS